MEIYESKQAITWSVLTSFIVISFVCYMYYNGADQIGRFSVVAVVLFFFSMAIIFAANAKWTIDGYIPHLISNVDGLCLALNAK